MPRACPIGIYTSRGFPESHHLQVVDGSIPTYRTHKNTPESHHLQVVGFRGIFPVLVSWDLTIHRLGAGGIRLNIICVDTNGARPWHLQESRRCRSSQRETPLREAVASSSGQT